MCKACHALDAGTCRSCLDHTCTAAVKELQSINVKLGGVMVLQGVIAPLTVWLWGYTSLSHLLGTMGVLAVCFGLTTIATKEVWSLGFAAMAGIGFLSFFGLLNCPPLVISVALLIVAWRLFGRSSRAEKEVYRLTQLR